MNLLLSLPPNVARNATSLPLDRRDTVTYVDSDPPGCKLGSGGGTAWIADRFRDAYPGSKGRTVIIHAGGQSRRLPAYAATGKSLTPLPVLRWAVGEKIDQTLLDAQLPLLERIVAEAPEGLDTLVASGDVLIRCEGKLPDIPRADVVCFGMWAEPTQACNHGVFFAPRSGSERHSLDFMLQKPTIEQLAELNRSHYYLMDIGLWLLSERAMRLLHERSTDRDGNYHFYDLYSQFGCALGANPSETDAEVNSLSVAIVPLHNGEFYHFGTTRQLLSSTLSLQNIVADQRRILHIPAKPNPALFVQNCIMGRRLGSENDNVWIENSFIGSRWTLTRGNVVTGVPENDWPLTLHPGHCLDIVPVDSDKFAIRPYGFDDPMRGMTDMESTLFLGRPAREWFAERGLECPSGNDIQQTPLFPIVTTIHEMEMTARWMLSEPKLDEGRKIWLDAEKVSADGIMERASLGRLLEMRKSFLRRDLPVLASNPRSVFYQLDLDDTAQKYHEMGLEVPEAPAAGSPTARQFHSRMFRSRVAQLSGKPYIGEEDKAFGIMRDAILSAIDIERSVPRMNVYPDQIVWGRSPVRIDLAGGWTDTPPYSLLNGGTVVNMAVELNSQPPLQVFIKPSEKHHILLRSIDMGASETISDFNTLTDFNRIGSPFSLPKAALAIAGFAPGFTPEPYPSLEAQLREFGCGIEITLLSALPAGSGMGTSSILAAAILGSLSDFCGLAWTADEICERVLAVEQLLTSGGGWQDQYGGVLQGIKLLNTDPGLKQTPGVNWLHDGLLTDAEYAPCHLLYYTGLTRTAKGILTEIVKRMFLNHGPSLRLLASMKEHALDMADAIQHRDFTRYGSLVGKSWEQNKMLDAGTCPEKVRSIISSIADLSLGMKLPGAGGGGYLYIVAKDPEAAAIIRRRLSGNGTARFAEMRVSDTGLQVSRS